MSNRRFASDLERRLYGVWSGMKQRCYYRNGAAYANYGGRGITVCDDWRDSFDSFYDWAAPLHGEGLTLDRIDNSGPYSPDNCRMVGRTVNAVNRRMFKNSPTGVKGVVPVKRARRPDVYRALISVGGERIYLGQYDTIFDAAAARISAENAHHAPLVAGG